MQFLLKVSRAIDAADSRLGKALGWFILAAVLVSSINAIIRFAFNISSNSWLELQWYLFSAVFLLGAGYTLLKNEHIKIDIVNSRLPKALRNWIEIAGLLLFLLPFCAVMIYTSVPFFTKSFAENEYSSSAGGLIVWPAKFMVPLGFALILVQGVSELIKRVAVMRGMIPDPHENMRGHGVEG